MASELACPGGGLGTRCPGVALPRLPSAGCCHGVCLLPLPARSQRKTRGAACLFSSCQKAERGLICTAVPCSGSGHGAAGTMPCSAHRLGRSQSCPPCSRQPLNEFGGSAAPCITPASLLCPLPVSTHGACRFSWCLPCFAKPEGGFERGSSA